MVDTLIEPRSEYSRGRGAVLIAVVSLMCTLTVIYSFRNSKIRFDHSHPRFRSSIEQRNSSIRRLPQAIIIGVKKGGTRALLEYLRMHPDVKAAGPELHYFDRHYFFGSNWYRRRMPPTMSGQVAIEKTPSYFVTKEAPARIHAFDPNIKLIVVLRNPVTRALSDYAQNAAKRPGMASFENLAFLNVTKSNCTSTMDSRIGILSLNDSCSSNIMVNTSWGAIKIGLYHRYVRRWYQYFDPKQVHFVNGERLVSDPAQETNRVERFLGLRQTIDDTYFVYPDQSVSDSTNSTRKFPCLRPKRPGKLPRCLGKTKGRKHPDVEDQLLRTLDEFYRPHNEKLFSIIGQRFEW